MDKKIIIKILNELESHAADIADKIINFYKENGERQFIIKTNKKNGSIAVMPVAVKEPIVTIGNIKNSTDKIDYIDLAIIKMPKNIKQLDLKDISDFIISLIFDLCAEEDNIISEDQEYEPEIYEIPNKISKKKNKPLKFEKLLEPNDLFFTLPMSMLQGVNRILIVNNNTRNELINHISPSDFIIISFSNDGVLEAEIIECQIAMSPTFARCERILIDTKDKEIEDSSIYACFLNYVERDANITIRRVFKKGDDIVLSSDNPTIYEHTKDILIRKKDISNVILGKVIKKKSFNKELI
jgi:hypothetical protein